MHGFEDVKAMNTLENPVFKRVLFRRVLVWFLFDREGWWVTTAKGHKHWLPLSWCYEVRDTITVHSITAWMFNLKFSYFNPKKIETPA